jgi:hypothetical protein
MGVDYTTIPPIKYDDFIAQTTLELHKPPLDVFNAPNKIIHVSGTFIYVHQDAEGNAHFERCGRNDIHKVFPLIIEEFKCKILDYNGAEYPNCLT